MGSKKKKRTIPEQVALLLLISHRYVIFCIAQVDKNVSGQTISIPMEFCQGMLTTTTVNGHSLSQAIDTQDMKLRKGKKLEHSQKVMH